MSDPEKHQWYTNKELFERLGDLRDDFSELRSEMRATRSIIKQYNGLREELGVFKNEHNELKEIVQTIINEESGKNSVLENLRNWGGWVFGLITLLILIYNQIL